jgi:hypothetical protein
MSAKVCAKMHEMPAKRISERIQGKRLPASRVEW